MLVDVIEKTRKGHAEMERTERVPASVQLTPVPIIRAAVLVGQSSFPARQRLPLPAGY